MSSGLVSYFPTFHSYAADCLCGWGMYCDTQPQALHLLDHHEEGCNV